MSPELRGPPGGDGVTELRTREGEQDAGTREGDQRPESREELRLTPLGDPGPGPAHVAAVGGALRGRTRAQGPAQEVARRRPRPRRAAPAGSALGCRRCLAPPPGPAYSSRTGRAAASGTVAKCSRRRHGHPVAGSFPGPHVRQTPQARVVPSDLGAFSGPGHPCLPSLAPRGPQAVLQTRAHHLGGTSTPQAPSCAFGLSCSPRPSPPTKGPLSPLRPGLPSRQGPTPQDPQALANSSDQPDPSGSQLPRQAQVALTALAAPGPTVQSSV